MHRSPVERLDVLSKMNVLALVDSSMLVGDGTKLFIRTPFLLLMVHYLKIIKCTKLNK